jgi:hypothetical protein
MVEKNTKLRLLYFASLIFLEEAQFNAQQLLWELATTNVGTNNSFVKPPE